MTQSLAQGITSYALERYGLDPWVSGETLDKAPIQLFEESLSFTRSPSCGKLSEVCAEMESMAWKAALGA